MLKRIRRAFTLRWLVAELAELGLKVDYRSVCEFIHAEKLSFKKAWWLANAIVPTWQGGEVGQYQDRVDPERLVFVDETWTRTDMAALRGMRAAWPEDVPGSFAP